MVTLKQVEEARRRIADHVLYSPCARSDLFSRLTGCAIHFKFENLQVTGSFKERGALNKLLSLTEAERKAGVITASAGNHAQGVAYHAGRLGITATVVMPEGTPLIKATNARGYGAKVILHGASFDDAYTEALRIQKERGLIFVHPFDDEAIIAGQGTISLELLEQVPNLEAIVVPIGGGGLISGIALTAKEKNPKIRVVGVQTEIFPSMKRALEEGKPVMVDGGTTLADGIAPKRAGALTFEHVRKYVDEVVTVSEEEIASAILRLLEREKTVVEGAGAVGVAALLSGKAKLPGKQVAVILSGGNIDVNVISRIIERGLAQDGRLVRLTVAIPDKPGSLARLTATLGEQRANILEVHHLRAFGSHRLGETEVELTLETRGHEHVEELTKALGQKGYTVRQDA
jgi:threonine dehydratase